MSKMSKMLPGTQRETTPKHPRTVQDWNVLLSQVIQRAQATGDRRLEGLRLAMVNGQSEKILRQYSILSEADLLREFGQVPT